MLFAQEMSFFDKASLDIYCFFANCDQEVIHIKKNDGKKNYSTNNNDNRQKQYIVNLKEKNNKENKKVEVRDVDKTRYIDRTKTIKKLLEKHQLYISIIPRK